MALVQTVMWTAVPNGIDTATGMLKVRCLVSPRLSSVPETNQTLGVYVDWPNWTTKVAAAGFNLSLQVGGITHANLVPDQAVLKPSLWPALFPASMLVRPFKVADLTTKKIRSYPVKNILDAIKDVYAGATNERPEDQGRAGKMWLEVPTIRTIKRPRNDERTFLSTVDGLYRDRSGAQIYALPPSSANNLTDFLQLLRFHWTPPVAPPVAPRAFADTTLDFHQVVSLLMEYPALQRALGLTLDFLVPVAGLPIGNTTVKVLPPSLGHLTPTTAATFGPDYFWPRAGGDVVNNRLALSAANFSVVTVDVDGAAIKLRMFADNMQYAQSNEVQFLPSLRSAGLAVARTGQAFLFNGKFGKAKTDNTTIVGGGGVTLDAASLLHGLRWQAYDVGKGRWFSLCERDVRYHFLSLGNVDSAFVPGPASTLREEGTVTAAAASRVNDGTDDLYLAEYLTRWHGENLVAARPGLSLLEHDDPDVLADPNPGPQKPTDPQLNVKAWPAPAGLPVLRFGRDYRLRALASYVGGAGVEFVRGDTSADFTHTTGEGRYARSEPVAPPEIVMCAAPTPGETVTDMVIRTEYDSAPDPNEVNTRHLLPPKVAQLFAEQLGMCDTASGFDPSIYPVLVARADGLLTEDFYSSDTNLDVPWLPDIYARGVALGPLAKIDFGYTPDSGNWQSINGVQIRIAEGSGPPASLPGGLKGLLLKLAKAEVIDVPLSSYLAAGHLDNLQIWRWFKEVTAGNPKYKKSAADPYGYYVDWATAGLLWTLSPKHRLRLICAVRQPLIAPAPNSVLTHFNLGDNFATAKFKLAASRKSTVSLDIRASWTELSDKLAGSDWESVSTPKSVDLGEIPVDPAGPEGEIDLATLDGGGVRVDFHDTKAHYVTYRARAKSRFAEYFTERETVAITPAGVNPAVVNGRGVADGTEIVSSGNTTFVRGTDYVMDYDAGTLTRTPNSAINGTVSVEFLPSITRHHSFSTWTLARTRPAAPIPVQVLPTFGWDTQSPSADPNLPGDVLSHRSGNGLRIYFSPPWYSSGEDEKLGVVFSSTPGILDHMRPFVTQWAGDPAVVDGQLVAPVPQVAHVLGSPTVSGLVSISELPSVLPINKQVRVVQLTPQWDNERQLYYADLELTAANKAYLPFIRLALCRYQPHSMTGIEMSQVRLADFAQLSPDRWVSLAYGGVNEVTVTVVGHSYLGTFSSAMRGGNVMVTVERTDVDITDPDLTWTPVSTTQLAPGVAWPTDINKTMWTGKVTLPGPHSNEYRLVIQETERWPGGERIAFTDVVPLS
ncbi:MAG TPA: hypothetical protein VFC19_11170 [Candidatus Limnocylindrales bacterium]|nr:hypothetical protein [Candidatus Limnocylindrales bacterium]